MADNSDFYTYVAPGSPLSEEDTVWADDALFQAQATVDRLIGSAVVPDDTRRSAYYSAGAEIFYRRGVKFGVTQYADPNGASLRIARDPLQSVYPILKPYLIGIA